MKAFRTISAFLLVTLVLVSSTSFIVGVHLCMGEVENVALFSRAGECEKEQSLPPCHRHMTPPCCDDETLIHENDDFNTSIAGAHISSPAAIDIEQPLVLVAEIIPGAPASRAKYINYDPPLRSLDLTVEHHVFLI